MHLLKKIYEAAWNGRFGIVWPLVIRFAPGLLGMSAFMAVYAVVWRVIGYGFDVETCFAVAILGVLLLIFMTAAWWLFSASCRLMWYHSFASASGRDACPKGRLGDLPVMLGIDAAFGMLRWINIGAVLFGLYGVMVTQSYVSLLALTAGAVMAVVCSILQPAVTAHRVVTGPGLLKSVRGAVARVTEYPATTLCMRFLPDIFVTACYAAAVWEGVAGCGWGMAAFAAAGIVVSLIRPVFWTEFMRASAEG